MNTFIVHQSSSSKDLGWNKHKAAITQKSHMVVVPSVATNAKSCPKIPFSTLPSSFDKKPISSQLCAELLSFKKTTLSNHLGNTAQAKQYGIKESSYEYLDYEMLLDPVTEGAMLGHCVNETRSPVADLPLDDLNDRNINHGGGQSNKDHDDENTSVAFTSAHAIVVTLRKKQSRKRRNSGFSDRWKKQPRDLQSFLSSLGDNEISNFDDDAASVVSTDTEDSIVLAKTKLKKINDFENL